MSAEFYNQDYKGKEIIPDKEIINELQVKIDRLLDEAQEAIQASFDDQDNKEKLEKASQIMNQMKELNLRLKNALRSEEQIIESTFTDNIKHG